MPVKGPKRLFRNYLDENNGEINSRILPVGPTHFAILEVEMKKKARGLVAPYFSRSFVGGQHEDFVSGPPAVFFRQARAQRLLRTPARIHFWQNKPEVGHAEHRPSIRSVLGKLQRFSTKITDKAFSEPYPRSMPWGLKRFHETSALHFVTWSCCDRRALLSRPERRDLLLKVLEQMRNRYRFAVLGFVVMPEHAHMLMSEPLAGGVSSAMAAIKLGFTRRVLSENPHFWQNQPEVGHPYTNTGRHFWIKRYYDFNVYSEPKIAEKLHYMHHNPVVAGLVERPEQWKWSSFRAYACCEEGGIVKVNDWSWWEKKIQLAVS